MEHLLDGDSALHGRFRFKIKIEAFSYYDAANFYKNVSPVDKVRYYSVFGGTPYYLSMIDEDISFEENVKKLILREFAPLENEIKTTLAQEYSKIKNAAFVMNLIVSGKHSYSDINSVFKEVCKGSDFAYLLQYLIDMRFIKKNYAINDAKESKAYYEIVDNLFSFYYLLVYPRLAQKEILSTDDFFKICIEQRMNEEFIPHKFEQICLQFLLKENKEGRINPPILSLGSYTYNDPKAHKNGQFDIVSQDEKGNIFYECKFTKEKISKKVFEEEKSQIEKAKLPFYRLGFFSKNGYEGLLTNASTICYTLNDLYK